VEGKGSMNVTGEESVLGWLAIFGLKMTGQHLSYGKVHVDDVISGSQLSDGLKIMKEETKFPIPGLKSSTCSA
jgi:hypothetical protein